MTSRQDEIRPSDDEWAASYMAAERRRNIVIGVSVLGAAILATILIVAMFAGTAAIPW